MQSIISTNNLTRYLPSTQTINRSLLGISVVLSILAFLPSLRAPASLALRSVACLSSAVIAGEHACSGSKFSYVQHMMNIGKIAAVVLGLAGLIVASPVVLLASLVVETALQAFLLVKSIAKLVSNWSKGTQTITQDFTKVLVHIGLLSVSALVIAAIISGGWPLIIAAAVVNAFVMGFIFFKAVIDLTSKPDFSIEIGNVFEMVCYFALFVINISSTAGCLDESQRGIVVESKFKVTNDSDKPLHIYGPYRREIAVVAPGETLEYSIKRADYNNTRPFSYGIFEGESTRSSIDATENIWEIFERTEKITPPDFPTVPIGGTNIVTQETAIA